jgi:hypothetical protein
MMPGVSEYALGAKPDRPDPRDYRFAQIAEQMAPDAALVDRKFYSMVNKDFRIDQGSEGTCVGHGATNLLLAGPTPHPDYPAFATESQAHQFARKLYLEASGDATYQQGMYPRDACAELVSWELISSYWKVMQVDEVTTALLSFGPVMICIPWYASMYIPVHRGGNSYIRVNLGSEHVGYHCVALTGVDLDPDVGLPFVRVENSWGSDWGTNGTARLTVENFRRLNIWDNWTFQEGEF